MQYFYSWNTQTTFFINQIWNWKVLALSWKALRGIILRKKTQPHKTPSEEGHRDFIFWKEHLKDPRVYISTSVWPLNMFNFSPIPTVWYVKETSIFQGHNIYATRLQDMNPVGRKMFWSKNNKRHWTGMKARPTTSIQHSRRSIILIRQN